MTSTTTLTGSLLRTYNAIFQHPVSHNLEWHHVYALFRHLGVIEEEHNGNLKVTRNGESLILHPPRTKDLTETEEIMAVRHFLERSENAWPTVPEPAHWLLVIDHDQARLFRLEMRGTLPQKILPHGPDRYFRHAQNSQNFSRGKEISDPNSFFEPIAKALQATGPIVIFGTGKGKSSELGQFVSWMWIHHPELAKRIAGSLAIDAHHLTDGQLLEKAQGFYENITVT